MEDRKIKDFISKELSNFEFKRYSKGFKYFGVGVSGGEEGALNGPALMPGGNKESYKEIKEGNGYINS